MDDAALAGALQVAIEREAQARASFEGAGEDLAERDNAQIALRHVTAYRKSLESWIGRRAMRAQFAVSK